MDVVKEFTNNACLEVSSIFDAMVRRSSAWAKAPRERPLMLIPRDFDLISDSIGSMTRLNSVGERMEPWRIPRQMAKGSDVANNYYYSYRVSRWLVRLQYNYTSHGEASSIFP